MSLHFERYFSHHGIYYLEVSLDTYPQKYPKNIFFYNAKRTLL